MNLILFVCVIYVTSVSGQYGRQSNAFNCRGKADGFYVDRSSQCRKYFICDHGRRHAFDCPAGTLFNDALSVCDHKYNVDCADQGGEPAESSYGQYGQAGGQAGSQYGGQREGQYGGQPTPSDKYGGQRYDQQQGGQYGGASSGQYGGSSSQYGGQPINQYGDQSVDQYGGHSVGQYDTPAVTESYDSKTGSRTVQENQYGSRIAGQYDGQEIGQYGASGRQPAARDSFTPATVAPAPATTPEREQDSRWSPRMPQASQWDEQFAYRSPERVLQVPPATPTVPVAEATTTTEPTTTTSTAAPVRRRRVEWRKVEPRWTPVETTPAATEAPSTTESKPEPTEDLIESRDDVQVTESSTTTGSPDAGTTLSPPMKMIESIVGWMVSSDDDSTPSPQDQAALNVLEKGMISHPRPKTKGRSSYRREQEGEVTEAQPESTTTTSTSRYDGPEEQEGDVYQGPEQVQPNNGQSQRQSVDSVDDEERFKLYTATFSPEDQARLYRDYKQQYSELPLDTVQEPERQTANIWTRPTGGQSGSSSRGSRSDASGRQEDLLDARGRPRSGQKTAQFSELSELEKAPVGRLDKFSICRCPSGPQFY
ncbi:hypothetical protein HDE_12750 [Halotydeus destructor]|nr:hypothetical protein HDE_12750 [Halotydeus destructor]